MKIFDLIPRKESNEKKRDDILRIDCMDCEMNPDYGNAVCVRCISRKITDEYRPESIILYTGVEREYSGEAARLICDLSKCVPHEFSELKEERCKKCNLSPLKIDDEMWNLFSIDGIDSLISRLDNTLTDGKGCDRCIVESKKRLTETRNRLYLVSKDALATAYRITGV